MQTNSPKTGRGTKWMNVPSFGLNFILIPLAKTLFFPVGLSVKMLICFA